MLKTMSSIAMQGVVASFALVFAFLLFMGQACAQDKEEKTFAVFPFEVNGPEKYTYLKYGVRDMMISRLSVRDTFTALSKDALTGIDVPASDAAAEDVIEDQNLDHLVWGSLTILGDAVSVDMRVKEKGEAGMSKSRQTTIAELIPELESMAKEINTEILGVQEEVVAAPKPQKQIAAPLNPGLLYADPPAAPAEPGQLNPQFQYDSVPASGRTQSNSLNFAATGMIVDDLDGDGGNEVVFMTKNDIYVYRWQAGRLEKVDVYEAAPTVTCLRLDVLDIDNDGGKEIIVPAVGTKNDPRSFILSFKDQKLKVVERRINLYLNVVRTAPDYMPVLVGQRHNKATLVEPGVYNVVFTRDGIQTSTRIMLPKEANLFNFTFLPDKKDGDKLVMVDEKDRLRILGTDGKLKARTEEEYSASVLGVELMSELSVTRGKISEELQPVYYVPIRTLAVDLEQDGSSTLLAYRPITVAGQFFKSYREYQQGEIHALAWDGIGLSLQWKTKRIKGTITDFGIGDANNDGVLDLVVCINTGRSAFNFESTKSRVLIYPLSAKTQ
jgi:hypothetical protein